MYTMGIILTLVGTLAIERENGLYRGSGGQHRSRPPMTLESKQFDAGARAWMNEAGSPRELGTVCPTRSGP